MSSILSPNTTHVSRRTELAREASPNYFGLSVDNANTTVTSSGGIRGYRRDRSPTSPGVRSSAVSPPQTLPFHSTTNNSEFDAFKKEIEKNKSGYNQIRTSHDSVHSSKVQAPPRHSSRKNDDRPASKNPSIAVLEEAGYDGKEDPEPTSRSPKRALSTCVAEHDRPRPESPAPPSKYCEKKVPRLQNQMTLSHEDLSKPMLGLAQHRAETLPEKFDSSNPSMSTPQHLVTLLDSKSDEILLLDLRVVTQYSQSHISGALNLCVPTTLLRRPAYNVAKLADTFKDVEQRAKFDQWHRCQYIVVYDSNSTQLKEAANCVNILKKFAAEGWAGESCIVRGGFAEFAPRFSQYVNKGANGSRKSSVPSLTLKIDDPSVAPVIGGCPMPATKTAANPFFGNIRQNMDLIGGVGQMPITIPKSASKDQLERLPLWLRKASDNQNEGKLAANKFLHIEKREQKRMQEALSGNVTYGTPGPDLKHKVEIAGIEKGAKNRYNNIWPFEHTRVRLEGVPSHGCDYFNANYVGTSLSEKNYIATQGPIPATFNDFWSVVWQSDVRVIVMLTAESEGGQVKAHNYWDQKRYGQLRLRFLSEHRASIEPNKIRQHRERTSLDRKSSSHSSSDGSSHVAEHCCGPKIPKPTDSPKSPSSEQPYVIVRKFTLAHEGKPFERMREITQLQYSSWPDFGAPADPAHLLGLVQQCNAVVKASAGSQPALERPVLVHCSAGCGRTGTFCTVDSVLDMIKRQKSTREAARKRAASPLAMEKQSQDDFFSSGKSDGSGKKDDWLQKDDMDLIEQTVEEFRLQRLSMVQSLRQFVLCYETVLEWLISQDQERTE